METTEKNAFRDNAMRVVAIIGLIAILLLGAWGIIQLAFYIPTLFSGSSSRTPSSVVPTESISVSANSPVTSGDTLTVSWRGVGASSARGYTVSYSCVDGLSIKAPTPSGKTQEVPCDTPFNFTGANSSMALTPTLAGPKQVSVTFTVTAVDLADNKVTATGRAQSTVLPKNTTPAKPVATKTTTAKATYTAAPRVALHGYADLAVRVLSVTPAGNRSTVQFEVSNIGTNVAPYGWSFNALLPIAQNSYTNQPYSYPSGAQRALNPSDKIVYTLTFDSGAYNNNQVCAQQYPNNCYPSYYNNAYYTGTNCYLYDGRANYPAPCTSNTHPYPYLPARTSGYTDTSYNTNYGNRAMTIQVDPYNQVAESNEVNNTATAWVW